MLKIVSLIIVCLCLTPVITFAYTDINTNKYSLPIDTITTINTEKNNTNISLENSKFNNEINISNITCNSAEICWNKNDNDFIQYNIYQFNWVTDSWVLYNCVYEKSFTLKNLLPATPYKYQIRINNKQATLIDETIIGDVLFYTEPETTNLSIKNITAREVVLEWKDVNPVSSYLLYRGDAENNLKLIKEIPNGTTTYIDNDIVQNQIYYYKIVCSYNGKDYSINSDNSNIVQAEIPLLKPMSLPSETSGICKTYAYYTAVTVKNSPQYAVLNSGTWNGTKYETYTDPATGIRMIDDCYCAALGTFYGTKMGTRYLITLESGKTFKIILCDSKADRHTDSTNRYALQNKDIIEFYVEPGKVPRQVNGSYNVLPEFNGAIKSIEKIS